MNLHDNVAFVRIPLSRGLFTLVDAIDAEQVAKHNWYAKLPGPGETVTYAYRNVGRVRQSMHRFLTGWSFVDHRNGNGLDNRRCNLRPATPSQNIANKPKCWGASRYKGVRAVPRNKKNPWVAAIQARHIGYFPTEEAAARAYDAAARETFGEFATLNFAQSTERSAIAVRSDADPLLDAPVIPRQRRCRSGKHFLSDTNSYFDHKGHRTCKTCHLDRTRERRHRQRAGRNAPKPGFEVAP
jgi:hypothetical protein